MRVSRGGSWNNDESMNLASSYRNNDTPDNRNDNNGFRCVVAVPGSVRRWRDERRTGVMQVGPRVWPAGAKKPT